MKQEFSQMSDADCSCLQVEVLVTEAWIDHFLTNHPLSIPVSDKYHLVHLKADLGGGKLAVKADIQELEGSSILLTCEPKWDVTNQRLLLDELKMDTVSKNILLKSAGWFAKTFMGAKIDKKIEEASTRLYTQQMEIILREGITVPFSKGGSAAVMVRSILVTEMTFVDHSIRVKAMVDGIWKLSLDSTKEKLP